jgi:hypothetical protein
MFSDRTVNDLEITSQAISIPVLPGYHIRELYIVNSSLPPSIFVIVGNKPFIAEVGK